MIKLAIPGSAGRMGGMLIRAIAAAPDLELVAATDRPDSPFIGHDAGEVAKTRANGVIIGSEPETLFGSADVVIDFTSPAAMEIVVEAYNTDQKEYKFSDKWFKKCQEISCNGFWADLDVAIKLVSD